MDFTNLLTAVLTGGVFAFVQFLITRKDDKDEWKNKLEQIIKDIKDQLTKNEKDVLRTQMLLMILMRPTEKREILTLGQHYFEDLEGNWYMTDIFNKWLEQEGHSKPEWFKDNK